MPSWKYTVQGFKDALHAINDEGTNWAEAKKAAIEALKASHWYRSKGETEVEREYSDLGDLISEWEAADDLEWADSVIDQIYDLADEERIWLGI